MHPSLIERLPAAWQAGLVQIAHPIYKRFGLDLEMDRVYKELGVGRTSAFEAARLLAGKIESTPSSLREERKANRELQRKINLISFHNEVLRYLPEHPGAWSQSGEGENRHSFSEEFKDFLLAKKAEHRLEWGEISELLGIPEATLKKFKGQAEKRRSGDGDGGSPLAALPEAIVDLLREFFQKRSGKATAKAFAEKHPEVLDELKMSYGAFASLLLRLGFTSPNGIFLNNAGLDKIVRFAPNAVWGTDGKQMKIILNGEIFRFVWQCLIDYKSTVLVGGIVGEEETTGNLLEALRASKEKTGFAPMAIVIDGRLSENLPAIRSYLDELGIEIVRTFPGNPKSNGIVEGNFSIFERWVGGEAIVGGDTPEELAHSIAQMLTEVFTQLRNRQPRKALGQKSATEAMESALELSDEEKNTIRAKLQALANRFRNEQAQPIASAEKAQAIEQAATVAAPSDKAAFEGRLKHPIFTTDLILSAIAILMRQREKSPEKTFDHAYFGGILRNLADQRAVEMLYAQLEGVYSEHWSRMAAAAGSIAPEPAEKACERLATEYLEAKIPAQGWLALACLQTAFANAARGCTLEAQRLRNRLADRVQRSKKACADKRQRLLRTLFECESVVQRWNQPIAAQA